MISCRTVRRIYGLNIETDLPFQAPVRSVSGEPDVSAIEGFSLTPEQRGKLVHVYSSSYQDRHGRPIFELHQDGDRELLRFLDRAEFLFAEGVIFFKPIGKGDLRDVEMLLVSSVLAYWLELRGSIVLHASAVEVDSQAIVFLAPAGGGKSSLATAFLDAGYRVMSDDILPVDVRESSIEVASGYPEIKMNPDLGQHFLGAPFKELRLYDPRAPKRCLDLSRSEAGSFPDVLPLAAVYVLGRRAPCEGSRSIRIKSIAGHNAVIEIVRSTYTPTLVEGVGLAAERLDRIADLLSRVPLRRLHYETDFERLPEVVEALVEDARAI